MPDCELEHPYVTACRQESDLQQWEELPQYKGICSAAFCLHSDSVLCCLPVCACRYEGDWSSALYEGHGSETFAKGSTYQGQYSAGLRHGWGVCRFFNGDYFEGQWSKGLRDGYGMQQVGQLA